MNKQQTIETLQKQLPSFYSLEQVISIINGIEDNNTLNDDLIQMIMKKINKNIKSLPKKIKTQIYECQEQKYSKIIIIKICN